MFGLWHRFATARKGRKVAGCRSRGLNVEHLEDRRVLSGIDVTYHGGPLLQNVQIESVFYGQAWSTNSSLDQLLSQIDGFLQYFPTSPYMNVLKQYNVGDGSFLNDLVVPQNPTNGTIDDSLIRQLLNSEIASGQLSAPNANSLYIFFTTPGVAVTDNGQTSTRDFAGYHDTFTDSAGAPVYYAVVPYPTSSVVSNQQLTALQDITVILSHEISEAITDPDTQTGWFDPRNGEIGDIAEGHIGVLDGYVVQGIWSQAQDQIVIPSDTGGSSLEVNVLPVDATAGQEFAGVVATILDAPSGSTASSFSATIDWGDGATSAGTITVDPNGGFDISGSNTYTQAGTYPITITVRNQSGTVVGSGMTSATVSAAAATATLVAKGTVVNATAGQQFSGIVAAFTDSNANVTAGSFTTTIDWGDGTTSTGTVSVDPNGGFDVSGTHTYTASQNRWGFPFGGPLEDFLGNEYFVIRVTINDTTNNANATALSLAKVVPAQPMITVKGQNIEATAGQSFAGVVATFTDVTSTAPASEFAATINWGDGATSTGTVRADPNGGFDVVGTHTYSDATDWFGVPGGWGIHLGSGNRYFVITVTVTDTQTQATATSASLATVVASTPNLAVTAQNIEATAGQSFSGLVASFTDVNTSATAADFTATINWGDGTTSAGTVTADPNGGYDVSGTHTYALDNDPFGQDEETFVLSVSVKSTVNTDKGNAVALAQVAPASPNVQASGTVVNAVFNQPFSGTVATFTPQSSGATASDFTATINWGDGTTSTGTIVADANGGFDVTGSHTYRSRFDGGNGPESSSSAEPYLISVTIQNTSNHGVAQAISLASVTASPPALVATGANISPTAGTSFSGTMATFTDSDSTGTASFQALIAWGDGRISTGTVTANANGSYSVSGTHTYSSAGTYRILVRIVDADGNSTISTGTAAVTSSAMTASLSSMALVFLQSGEAESDFIIQEYQQLLGRTPSAAEVTGWVNAMQQGATETQVLVGFLSSPEFYARAGNSLTAYVDALYSNVLGRSADSAGQSSWVQALSSGVSSANVALAFLTSPERESSVVQSDYQQYLRRTASAAEVAGWVKVMQHGATSTQVQADFLGSQEYFQAHHADLGDWLSSVYESVLSRQPDQAGYEGWLAALEQE
jgi:hypothetical protein